MNNEAGRIVVLLAHPNMKESKANKELVNSVKENDMVFVYDLYERNREEPFDVDAWSRLLSEASALVFQFPLYWMSAPYMLKRWQDEVFTFLSKTPAITGKPLFVVTTTGSEYEAYRTGGRNLFTIDEILRPYQTAAHHAGMVWGTPIVVYGTGAEDSGKRISIGANQYKERMAALAHLKKKAGEEW
ncbi:NAD(P)H-dependent oxidoreductase [Bacteroides sp. OttesenSCG-928-J23]|nr:NAD(P)H-dependent oxidoreductase [Bacteroides sp. OttesenSCG-928-J23]